MSEFNLRKYLKNSKLLKESKEDLSSKKTFNFVDDSGNFKVDIVRKILKTIPNVVEETIKEYLDETESSLEPEAYDDITIQELKEDFLLYSSYINEL
jgi:hypothetical protein